LKNVKSISNGGAHTLALKEDGTIVSWGDNKFGQCNVPAGLKNIKEAAAEEIHSVAVKEDGTVIAWGDNIYNQCYVNEMTGVKAIDAGYHSTLVLNEDGTLNSSGEFFYNTQDIKDAVWISSGYDRCVVVKADGTMEIFYGPYALEPVFGEFIDIKTASAGLAHIVVLKMTVL